MTEKSAHNNIKNEKSVHGQPVDYEKARILLEDTSIIDSLVDFIFAAQDLETNRRYPS